MEYDPDNRAVQLQLTRICQVIANQDARRLLEMLAAGAMTIEDLEERIDGRRTYSLAGAVEMMVVLELVQKSGGLKTSDDRKRQLVVYELADGGFRLVRSWLDRVGAIGGH